jgi:DNA repair exonuclease SbcCD ATPase subunit
VAALKEEGLLVLGQVNALAQQIQRETGDVQTLSEEEQALTKEWLEICASLNITLNIQEDIAPWINEQEHYERQLYQLSQRLTLQNQLNEQEAQARQYQQQLTATRQTLEHTLLTLSQRSRRGERSRLAARPRRRIRAVAGKTNAARRACGTQQRSEAVARHTSGNPHRRDRTGHS